MDIILSSEQRFRLIEPNIGLDFGSPLPSKPLQSD